MKNAKVLLLFLSIISILITSAILTPAMCADVKAEINKSGVALIFLIGEIDRNTPKQIENAIRMVKGKSHRIMLHLNSGGGDIQSAIKIGELARKHEFFTVVLPGDVCASACSLTFLGGVSRIPGGDYGIHRPYSSSPTNTLRDANKSFDTVNQLVRDYLISMNITTRLLDAMNVVPPGEIRWLSYSEQREFGIAGDDPVYQERQDSIRATKLGIPKQELYNRMARAERVCEQEFASVRGRMTAKEAWKFSKCKDDIIDGRR